VLIILSPAKTMNFTDTILTKIKETEPVYSAQAGMLINILKNFDTCKLQKSMNLSDKLLSHVSEIIKNFSFGKINTRPAVFAYNGAVFNAIDFFSLNTSELDFAQKNIRILSALYGVLKISDKIEEYRLDMKTKIEFKKFTNLYQFWDSTINSYFSAYNKSEPILNLASNEFRKMINFKYLNKKVIDFTFYEDKNEKLSSPATYSKIARGKITGYIIRNQINNPEAIKCFDADGYSYQKDLSNDSNFIFLR
jgi:uncharacterized protein